jgi:hypothetical protein
MTRRWFVSRLALLQNSRLGLPQAGFAFYDKRTRWTCFPVVVPGEAAWRWIVYEHDGNWLSPYPQAMNETAAPGTERRWELRWANGWLSVWNKRGDAWRQVRRLAALQSEPVIFYPRDAHGDVAALWSTGAGVYYTNRDFKNVYRVPEEALRGRVKGERIYAAP